LRLGLRVLVAAPPYSCGCAPQRWLAPSIVVFCGPMDQQSGITRSQRSGRSRRGGSSEHKDRSSREFANPGVKLLALGKLGQSSADAALIPEVLGDAASPMKLRQSDEHSESPWTPIVEQDLRVQEYDSDDEEWCGVCAVVAEPALVPGRATARRLMEARAKQCVVCLTEKEHTFVPPHIGESRAKKGVEGHRFCTDCFADFLLHGMTKRLSSSASGPPPLTCPVCRCDVEVPDVWGVVVNLPAAWRRQSAGQATTELRSCAGAQPGGVAGQRWTATPLTPGELCEEPVALWAGLAGECTWESRVEEEPPTCWSRAAHLCEWLSCPFHVPAKGLRGVLDEVTLVEPVSRADRRGR